MKNNRLSSITLETKMTSRQLFPLQTANSHAKDAISSNYKSAFNLESNPILIISIPV